MSRDTVSATAEKICRALLGDTRKVDCDIIESHIRELLGWAPDAEEVCGLKPGYCHKCGLPLSVNPHPEAGKPDHYLEVGCPKECIPCLVRGRHNWAGRAMRDAVDAARWRATKATATRWQLSGLIDTPREGWDSYVDGLPALSRAQPQEGESNG